MPRKLSLTDWLLIAFTLMLTVSAAGIVIAINYSGSGHAIYAQKLNDKPENYSVLDNPDNYILQAIANNHSSVFKTLDLTQYDELQDEQGQRGFANIEYNSSYYKLSLAAVDSFSPLLFLLGVTGFSLVGWVILVALKIAQHDNRKHYSKVEMTAEGKSG